jgi:hypothetical protein
VFLATGLTAGGAQPEFDEKIISHSYSLKELKQMMTGRKLCDAKSIAAILYYLTFLK